MIFYKRKLQRCALQICIAIGSLVPVGAGLFGSLAGLGLVDGLATVNADSHFHYLSGLLLGIGIAFWSCIPTIERKTARFRQLTIIVFIGGLARGFALLTGEIPSAPMLFGLVMELCVTPLLCLWQTRIAKLLQEK